MRRPYLIGRVPNVQQESDIGRVPINKKGPDRSEPLPCIKQTTNHQQL
jgi:hypothetical protein